MCWKMSWSGLNAAINSCRSGSQWEYGPRRFFSPIFCLGDWLVEPKCSKWIKDVSASRKMSTDSLRDLTLDVFHMRLEFLFLQKFGQACGWVGT